MGDLDRISFSRPGRIAPSISSVLILILSLPLMLLVGTTAAKAIALPGYSGKCPNLNARTTDKPCVRALQDLLNELNIAPRLNPDGVYGKLTEDNVKEFQRSRHLRSQNGAVEQETAQALEAAWENIRAKKGKAAPQGTSPATAASSKPTVVASRSTTSTSSISLSDIIAIGSFVVLALAVVVFGRRLLGFSISVWGRVVITLNLAPTREQVQLEREKLQVERQRILLELARFSHSDKVLGIFMPIADFIINRVRQGEERQRGNFFLRSRKMIQGHVEEEKDD